MASGRKQSNISALHKVKHRPSRIPETEASIGKALSGSMGFTEPPPLLDLTPITSQISPEVREGAFIKDRYEGRINVFDELEKGNPLSDYGLKQMHHAFDMAEYSRANPKTPAQKNLLNQSRKQLQDALAQNDFLRVLREPNQYPASPVFKYKGLEVPKSHGFELMKKEQQSFFDKDRWLNPRELHAANEDFKQASQENDLLQTLSDSFNHPGGKPPIGYLAMKDVENAPSQWQDVGYGKAVGAIRSNRNTELPEDIPYLSEEEKIKKAQEIIRESGGREYYAGSDASRNYAWGKYSDNEPERINELGLKEARQYWNNASTEAGRDIVGPLGMLEYSNNPKKLKYAFFQTEGFQDIYERVKKSGTPERVTFETLRVPTGPPAQAATVGKVKVRFEGTLSREKDGRVRVHGITTQGDNAEVFTFPRGNRGWLEGPNEFGRSRNWTNFRTILEGDKELDVYLD